MKFKEARKDQKKGTLIKQIYKIYCQWLDKVKQCYTCSRRYVRVMNGCVGRLCYCQMMTQLLSPKVWQCCSNPWWAWLEKERVQGSRWYLHGGISRARLCLVYFNRKERIRSIIHETKSVYIHIEKHKNRRNSDWWSFVPLSNIWAANIYHKYNTMNLLAKL